MVIVLASSFGVCFLLLFCSSERKSLTRVVVVLLSCCALLFDGSVLKKGLKRFFGLREEYVTSYELSCCLTGLFILSEEGLDQT